jgi:hypothetical protein
LRTGKWAKRTIEVITVGSVAESAPTRGLVAKVIVAMFVGNAKNLDLRNSRFNKRSGILVIV